MSEPWDDEEAEEQNDLNEFTRLCACGCSQAEHATKGCLYCDDCESFTYDPEMTLMAAIFEDLP